MPMPEEAQSHDAARQPGAVAAGTVESGKEAKRANDFQLSTAHRSGVLSARFCECSRG